MALNDFTSISFIFIGLLLGGILKGATGAGLPIIAVPAIAAFHDVRLAVVLLVIPNFFTNIWQIKKYAKHNIHPGFTRNFAVAGIVGAGIGTALLAALPLALLSLLISFIVFLYIVLRLLRPGFSLSIETAKQFVFLSGTSAGILQGAVGLSSPITITFLHAINLPRASFILTSSTFFAGMCIIQLPMQILLGLMTWHLAFWSVLALIPIIIGLPMGEWVGKKLDQQTFNKIILVMLTVLGCKMFIDSIRSFLWN